MNLTRKAVVLISGGLDSTTTLAIAKSRGFECYALSFDYGQRNRSELNAANSIAEELGAYMHKIVRMDVEQLLEGSALTDKRVGVPDYVGDGKIPVTYVPARNTVFLSVAVGWAEVIGAYDIFIGVNAVDYSGYPDCRAEYIAAFEKVANLATKEGVSGKHFHIHTPLIYLSKAETIQEGMRLGVDYSKTVTCYQADENGKACGKCDSCHLRKQGFISANVNDPTIYRDK